MSLPCITAVTCSVGLSGVVCDSALLTSYTHTQSQHDTSVHGATTSDSLAQAGGVEPGGDRGEMGSPVRVCTHQQYPVDP